MGASLNDVKHRIASTKKTRQITNAMEMVSQSKLNQILKHTKNYDVYASQVKSVVYHLAQAHMFDDLAKSSDQDAANTTKRSAYLVITSDRGMVGSYNSNVLRETNQFIKEHSQGNDYQILAVGGTGADFYKKQGANVTFEYRGVSDVPTFDEIRSIVKTLTTRFEDNQFDELYVCYEHFVNRITSSFRAEKMLPIDGEALNTEASKSVEVINMHTEYDVEPSNQAVLDAILPQYSESLVYGAILDAKTAEHASSSTAMKSASDNADDLIGRLELQFNRARQAAITTEITEITGGQEALSQ
ncbi:ATP synthase subunit gamma [Lentilactobacillus senioris DSM 24302 = JCM 17472]|uniref:ATP synthase gamma chain n=1 Tax=Lentilactobacillus senioris DSM 24302 = JCM 17472 TaxID=1423802 RepID=A0A0R2CPC3_9LACO|nr:F0F1 ATP synthase subunit gamma [Lentilactobacillus senioris]KRM93631.1 ATP synthase subunit gamma [Lentilactobacillus senioris DSM 24302 = JCM 17472]